MSVHRAEQNTQFAANALAASKRMRDQYEIDLMYAYASLGQFVFESVASHDIQFGENVHEKLVTLSGHVTLRRERVDDERSRVAALERTYAHLLAESGKARQVSPLESDSCDDHLENVRRSLLRGAVLGQGHSPDGGPGSSPGSLADDLAALRWSPDTKARGPFDAGGSVEPEDD